MAQVSTTGGGPPTPAGGASVVVLRVTVRAPDLDAFITRYSRHISADRIFIFSKTPQPVGTKVRFNLQLANGEPLIHGRGTVKRMQADTGDARHPPGMELQFVALDERSQTLVDFMMATRAGLTEETKAAPIVRAVVPTASKLAALAPARPREEAHTPAPLPPAPAAPPPRLRKLTPVARPPSLSLEVGWKAEAGGAAVAATEEPVEASEPPTMVDAAPTAAKPMMGPPKRPTLAKVSPLAAPKWPPPAPAAAKLAPTPDVAPAPAVAPDAASTSAAPTSTPPVTTAPTSSVPTDAASVDSAPLFAPASAAPSEAAPTSATPADLALIVGAPTDPAAADPAAADPAAADLAPTDAAPVEHAADGVSPPGPAPAFAEGWSGEVPANPFSEVSDGAIEYFVEWSIEQSIGPRALPQANFSDVPMLLPGTTGSHAAYDPPSRRRQLVQLGAVFAVGVLVGGLVVGLVKRSPTAAPGAAAAVAAPVAPTPAAPPASADEPAEPAAGDAELSVITHPAGAAVTIDGTAAGETPLTTHLGAGKHEVTVAKERYASATSTVEAPGKLQLELHRPSATLHITSSPSAADVIVAGQPHGKTPVDVRLPGFESYDVRVALAGARPWRKSVYLAHASNRVDAALVVAKPTPAAKPGGKPGAAPAARPTTAPPTPPPKPRR